MGNMTTLGSMKKAPHQPPTHSRVQDIIVGTTLRIAQEAEEPHNTSALCYEFYDAVVVKLKLHDKLKGSLVAEVKWATEGTKQTIILDPQKECDEFTRREFKD